MTFVSEELIGEEIKKNKGLAGKQFNISEQLINRAGERINSMKSKVNLVRGFD